MLSSSLDEARATQGRHKQDKSFPEGHLFGLQHDPLIAAANNLPFETGPLE